MTALVTKEDIEGVLLHFALSENKYFEQLLVSGDIGGVARCQKCKGRRQIYVSMGQLAARF